MSRLPVVSGKQLIKILRKTGYFIVRKRGSHFRLHNADRKRKDVTVPNYKIIGRGLLRKILREAELPVSDFINLSKEK